MAFIEKKDPVVLNIKITSKGRELLSEGNLNFKYFAVGDSEIDYGFNSEVNSINTLADLPYMSSILGAVDKNPNLLSFITQNNNTEYYNSISTVPSTTSIIQNTAQPMGFFTIATGSTTFITDPDHVKQPDLMVKLNTVTGGAILDLYQSTNTYGGCLNDPAVGDLLLIKWTNPTGGVNTTGYTVNKTYPTPYLTYKIVSVDYLLGAHTPTTAKIATIHVDRNLPNFNGSGGSTVAGAMIYYNYINYTGDTIYDYYATDYLNESVITFLENAQCPTIRFPFWNMSIVFTDEIAGVESTNKKYPQFDSSEYGGFVSYIQNQAPTIKKLGIIHYTNSSPSNTYAEELYKNTPTLNIPTIMWHKSTNKELGVTLKPYGTVKSLTGATILGITRSLNTTYYDLADLNGNIVGKQFNDLKLFVIEDQELLFAMSYKSNRSWTLPNYTIATSTSAVFGCPDCAVEFNTIAFSPTVTGTNTGKIFVNRIINTIGVAPDVELVLSVSGETYGRVYFEPITGNTLVSNLYADTYNVIIYDLRASTSTCSGTTVVISAPASKLAISGVTSTASGLNPDFPIISTSTNNTSITINKGTTYLNGIGNTYGTPTVACYLYNTTPTSGVAFTGDPLHVDFQLSLTKTYTIVVKDTVTTPSHVFSVTKDFVAVGSPFNTNFLTSRGSDTGGSYVWISEYLTTLDPNINPIIGTIEFIVTDAGSHPSSWVTLPTGTENSGVPIKIYCGSSSVYIKIREVHQAITVAEVSTTIDPTGVVIPPTN